MTQPGNVMAGSGDRDFWALADRLVDTSDVVIDRPRGSRHPRYPDVVYPLDYGYLEGTTAADGDGIDIWRGSLADRRVSGMIVTTDLAKRDTEIKLLIGCTDEEMEQALEMHRSGSQGATLIRREWR